MKSLFVILALSCIACFFVLPKQAVAQEINFTEQTDVITNQWNLNLSWKKNVRDDYNRRHEVGQPLDNEQEEYYNYTHHDRNPEHVAREIARDRIIRKLPNMCLLAPILHDGNIMIAGGCILHF